MDNVLKIDSGFDFLFSRLDDCFIILISVCAVLLGLFLGLKNKQIICKELQPIIHNIHSFIPMIKNEEKKDNEVKQEEEVNKEDEVPESGIKND
jgi:hypothetical protein